MLWDDFLMVIGMLFIAWVIASANSHWFSFLLSAKFSIRISNRTLQSVLLFGSFGWDRKNRVAPEDLDKMSLTGLIAYLAFAVDIFGIVILRFMLEFRPLSPLWEPRLYDVYRMLGGGYFALGVGLFLLGYLDYYIGKSDFRA